MDHLPATGDNKGKEPAYCPARVLAGSKVIDCQIINITNKGARLSLDEEAALSTPFVLEIGQLGSLLAETSPGRGRRFSVTFLDQESRVTEVLQAVTKRFPDTDQRRTYPPSPTSRISGERHCPINSPNSAVPSPQK